MLLLLLLSRFCHVWLCATPETAAHQAPPSLGFSRQEHWSGLPFPSPMHESESEKWKWSHSVVSNSQRPHGLQPTRLLRPWDLPGKSTGVGCHCLLQVLQSMESQRVGYDWATELNWNTNNAREKIAGRIPEEKPGEDSRGSYVMISDTWHETLSSAWLCYPMDCSLWSSSVHEIL